MALALFLPVLLRLQGPGGEARHAGRVRAARASCARHAGYKFWGDAVHHVQMYVAGAIDILIDLCYITDIVRAPAGRFTACADGANALNHALRARLVEVPVFPFQGALHVRISAQVYNVMADYERLAELMLEVQSGQPGSQDE